MPDPQADESSAPQKGPAFIWILLDVRLPNFRHSTQGKHHEPQILERDWSDQKSHLHGSNGRLDAHLVQSLPDGSLFPLYFSNF